MSEHPSVAEQAVIGAILLNPELIKECQLQEEHFYESRHKSYLSSDASVRT